MTDRTDEQQGALEDARGKLRHTILHLAVAGYGATRTEEPIEGYKILTNTVLDDPLAAVRAARFVRGSAGAEISRYVDEARAAGKTWDEVAEALDIEPDEDNYSSRAELAYRHIVEREQLPVARRNNWSIHDPHTSWRCRSCKELVIDRGPFESHPDDRESGHAESCARHTAAVAAWQKELGD
jgi:hypothetical protein